MKSSFFLFVIILLILKSNLCAQNSNTIIEDGNFDSIELLQKERERFVILRVDSLNNWKNSDMPFFLKEYDFDYHYSNLWDGLHQPISLRKLIMDKVTNKAILLAIIKSKKIVYKRISKLFTTYYQKSTIPFQNFSNRLLAKQQLIRLKGKLTQK